MNTKVKNQIYKCAICGNTVEIVHGAVGTLVCCGKEMDLLKENTVDASAEKHKPVLVEKGPASKVMIGSVPHPMEPKHYIEWIEIINGDYVNRKYLKAGDKPEADFYVHKQPGLIVRGYCNLHGLWQA